MSLSRVFLRIFYENVLVHVCVCCDNLHVFYMVCVLPCMVHVRAVYLALIFLCV